MAGNVRLGGSEFRVDERAGQVLIPIERDDTSGRVEVEYFTTEDSASSSADYTDVSGTVVFEDGEAQKFIAVPIVDDALPEGSESFVFRLLSVTNAFLQFPRTATVVVADDEAPDGGGGGVADVDFTVTGSTFVSGLNEPIAFQWLPGQPETLLIAEKPGVVRVFRDGALLAEPFIDLSAEINERQDRGLLDIELHPDFPNMPYVYLYYVADPADTALHDPSSPAGPDGNGNRFAYLVRVTADAGAGYLKALPGSQVILVGGAGQSIDDISGGGLIDSTTDFDQPPSGVDPVTGEYIDDYIVVDSRSHSGGDISFGPDGALYLSTGDGASFNGVDHRGVRVQDIDSLAGKILRIDPITGEGLPENPFVQPGDSLDANHAKVFQLGLRNPFRTAFDTDGDLFIGNVGWNQWEEIDVAGPGANFGWPFFEGGGAGASLQTPKYKDLPEAQAFYASGQTVEAPFLAFKHPSFQSLILGDVYSGSVYPGFLRNDLFFTDISNGGLYAVDTRNPGEPVRTLSQTAGAGIVYMGEGPDGLMYYADLFAGVIGRWSIDINERVAAPGLDFDYDGFSDGADFFANGSAAHVGSALRLTSANTFQAGSVFFKDPLKVTADTSFSTEFSFTMKGGDGPAGADGLAFVIHGDAAGVTALGDPGGSLGLANYDPLRGGPSKIGQSLAITFDTLRNPWQANANEIVVVVDGEVRTPLASAQAGFDLNGSGAPRYAWIDYDGEGDSLQVYLSKTDVKPGTPVVSATVDLAKVVGGEAFVGFTGATGTKANDQSIEAWHFSGGDTAPPAASFAYDDFAETSQLQWNGSAKVAAGVLELTPAAPQNQAGSAFFTGGLALTADTSFSTEFSFRMSGGTVSAGGDGLAFVIHGDPAGVAALGDPGASLGLANYDPVRGGPSKIVESLAIAFDTVRNPWQAKANEIVVVVNGEVKTPLALAHAGFDLNGSSALRYAWIDYDGEADSLQVYLAKTDVKPEAAVLSVTVDLAALVGEEAFVGFTGATGTATNAQEILAWSFESDALLV